MKAKALTELNLARDVRGDNKSLYRSSLTEGRPGKMWTFSRKKQETWLPRIWRRLR